MAMPKQKYLFETSFDPEDPVRDQERRKKAAALAAAKAEEEAKAKAQEQPPPPPEPTFSKAELNAARAEGHKAGQEAGRVSAQATIEKSIADALTSISRKIGPLREEQIQARETMVEHSVQVSLAITRKVLPEFSRRDGLQEIEAIVRECLHDMTEEPRIVIRVADAMLDPMRARVDPVVESLGFTGSIVLLAEPGLEPADCRVEWADGGAERMARQVWQDVDAAVARFLDYPQTELPVAPTAKMAAQAVAAGVPETGNASSADGGKTASDQTRVAPAADKAVKEDQATKVQATKVQATQVQVTQVQDKEDQAPIAEPIEVFTTNGTSTHRADGQPAVAPTVDPAAAGGPNGAPESLPDDPQANSGVGEA